MITTLRKVFNGRNLAFVYVFRSFLGLSNAVVMHDLDSRGADVDIDPYLLVDFLIPVGHRHLADELRVGVSPECGRRLSHAFDAFDAVMSVFESLPTFGHIGF